MDYSTVLKGVNAMTLDYRLRLIEEVYEKIEAEEEDVGVDRRGETRIETSHQGP